MKITRTLIIQFVKFGLVGVVGFGVDVGVLKLGMLVFGFGPYSARALSFCAAVFTTWICNRSFTFRGQRGGSASREGLTFLLVCCGGFVLNYGTYAALVASVPFILHHPEGGVAAGSLAGMFFNFGLSKKLVFRDGAF